MPEIEISTDQSVQISRWLAGEEAAGRAERILSIDKDVDIHLVDGDPVVFGGSTDQDGGEAEWVSSSAKVFDRMREAQLDLSPAYPGDNLPIVEKWIWSSGPVTSKP